jgi:pre-mRNA-splicing helicase BRR2
MSGDLGEVLDKATRLLQAIVDVISSSGWLAPALAAMELSQMCVQGMWDRDSALLQLPHVSRDLAKKCIARQVESIFDLMDMEDDERRELLGLSPPQLADVARVCNRYPNIDLSYEVEDADELVAGESVSILVNLTRDAAEGEAARVPKVHAPRFPKEKEEGWWLVVGDSTNNSLLCIKRITLQLKARIKLDFVAPEAGEYAFTLFLMCDSYLGCDQEYELKLSIAEDDGDEDEGDEDEDEDADNV